MNQNNKIKDIFAEVLEEAIGPGAYIPAGMNTIASDPMHPSGRRGQNPPYSVYTRDDKQMNGLAQQGLGVDLQDRSETDAPKVAPYPLQTVIDNTISAYMSLDNVRKEIELALINPVVTDAQSKELKNIDDKLKTIMDSIKDTSDKLLKIYI